MTRTRTVVQPSAGLDELRSATAALSQTVAAMQAGTGDRSAVARAAGDVLAYARAARPEPTLLMPDLGALEAGGRDRAREIHASSARVVGPLVGRSADDVALFQRTADRLLLLSTILGVDARRTAYYQSHFLPARAAAMDTQTAGAGADFVPSQLSAQLIERVSLELLVAPLFTEIPMPSDPYVVPGAGLARVRGGRHVEQTADSGQTKIKKVTPASRKIELRAAKLAAEVLVSTEEAEDALVQVLSFIETELVDGLAADIEDALVNGDTAVSHMDSDVTDADDPRVIWDGLRKHVLAAASTSGSNATLTDGMLRTNRARLGRYGVRANRLAHIVGIAGYLQLLGTGNVLTVDKYGPYATILTGELGKVDGIPIIVSEFVRADLNASGVYDGVTDNRSIALTVARNGFVRGLRRGMTVSVLRELYSESDQIALTATTRRAFEPRYPTDTETLVAQTYNLST